MQLTQKIAVEYVAFASVSPAQSFAYIDLLCFIQLTPQRNVGRYELFALLGSQRRIGIVFTVEERIRRGGPGLRSKCREVSRTECD